MGPSAGGRFATIVFCGYLGFRRSVYLFAAACVLLGLTVCPEGFLASAIAQQPSSEASGESTTPALPPRIDAPETPPRPTLYEQIDRTFASLVSKIERVLFYRLGAEPRHFVQLQHYENFVRDKGSEGPFQRLDPNGEYPKEQLTPREVQALATRDMLSLGPSGNAIRQGTVDNRNVEFVRVIIDESSKYILTDIDEDASEGKRNGAELVSQRRGDFKLQLPKRELISQEDDDVLTWDGIERLSLRGRLAMSDDPVFPSRPYLLTESVGGAPVVVLWLAGGSIFFTFFMGWFNVWGFPHALQIVRGRYDNPDEPGEVTHFQALASALSATVGLGNIAGVTVAMTLGGPGAFFWMVISGIFGMTSKFVECTLGQKYRRVKPDGTVLGGPMQYLHEGLAELGLAKFGLLLSILFSVMCILASFGGGNMFQANQSGANMLQVFQSADLEQLGLLTEQIRTAAEEEDFDRMIELDVERQALMADMEDFKQKFLLAFGVLLAMAVAFVIIGGIRRIGAAAEKLVPTMCVIYIAACLWIILSHVDLVPSLVGLIFQEAFTGRALGGGFVGVMVLGIQRAAFSNEAGVGSAAIAHSAAKTDEPVREGAVALMGPFIDTVVVCSMTALVILITGAWDNDIWVVHQGLEGSALTSVAFKAEIPYADVVLAGAVLLFAFSTIISWSYYGERCWERLFGARSTILYRIIYVFCVMIGAVVNLGAVLAFSDMMILSMAFPNVLGVVLLSPKVKRDLKDYWSRYRAGQFKTYK